MSIRHLSHKITGAILGFTFLLCTGVGVNMIGHAQDRNRDGYQDRRGRDWDRYGNYGGSFQLRQTALNAGYNEGMKEGTKDREQNRRPDYRDSNAYQKATKDYSSRLGSRELYRRYFREGFETGYADGYGQSIVDDRHSNRDRRDRGNRGRRSRNWDDYSNYGGTFQLRQTALNAGYNEGIKQGRKDRNKSDAYDFQDQSAYRKATKDYNSRLGDRELYRRYFREGYENGYSDGMNGY
jgi:hypothetical protein